MWEGLSEELRKQGADDAFFEGIVKEASALGLMRQVASHPGLWKQPLNLARSGWKALRSGAGASAAAADAYKATKGTSAMVDAAGDLVSHAPTLPKHVPGARSQVFTDAFEAGSKKPLTIAQQESIDGIRGNWRAGQESGARGATAKALKTNSNEAVHNAVYELDAAARKAPPGTPGATGDWAKINKGDYSPIQQKLNLSDETTQAMGNYQNPTATGYAPNIPAATQMDKITGHAADMAAQTGGDVSGVSRYKVPKTVRQGAPANTGHVRFSPGKGLGRAATWGGTGAMLGMAGGPGGMLAGGLAGAGLGLATGTLGTGGAALAGGGLAAAGAYGGYKALTGKGSQTDQYGEPTDRNRAVPFMKNNWAGGIGGALLGMLIANEMGASGPMAMLAPVIGGVAGYKYLPQMMNRWKDPYGVGANSISSGAAQANSGLQLGLQ